MRRLQFAGMCLYYYLHMAGESASVLVATLAGLYFTHKIVGWALWVLSL